MAPGTIRMSLASKSKLAVPVMMPRASSPPAGILPSSSATLAPSACSCLATVGKQSCRALERTSPFFMK